ncbi:MAG: iron-containing alcohol dehydrogenase [Reichenbachiella sp.]
MIDSFHFTHSPSVFFGNGKFSVLPDLINQKGKTALFVTGAQSFTNSKSWKQLQNQLDAKKLDCKHTIISCEPSPQSIDSIVSQYQETIDVVVAIGGGSVLDAGKAVSAMLGKKESVKDFLEGVGTKTHNGSKIPFIAVPTTSGTGSEATKNAVLSEIGINGYKKSLRHDRFVPDVALIDPELTLTCPKILTGASGMDAFTQLLESFLSSKASIMTDSLALKGLSCIRNGLTEVMKDGQNLGARTNMAYASFASGLTLANAGLGSVHGMAGVIGGYFEMPHGTICGTLMSAVNSITVRKLRKEESQNIALKKYAKVGKMFSQRSHKSEDFHIDFLLNLIDEWCDKFEIPLLSNYGINSQDLDRIVQNSSNKNNPVALTEDDMREALSQRI